MMLDHLRHWDQGGPAPPFSELFKDESVTDELEAENRTDLLNEVNQARLAEFLATAGSYEPDVAALEAADRSNQQHPYYQEQFEDFMQAVRDEEAMMRDHPFFLGGPLSIVDPGRPALPAQEPPPLEISPSLIGGSPPPKGPVLPTASGSAGGDRISPYDAMQWIIHNVHVVHANGLLYFYDGTAYLPCKRDEAKKRIMEACRPAVKAIGNARFVQQVYDLLTVEPRICRDADLFRNLVAFNDGVLDLDTGQFQPHTPTLFVTTRLKASYRSGRKSDCPVFKKFLADISCGDSLLVRRLWECVAYLLVPDQAGKRFILFQGVSNSGKSVLGNFIQDCFTGNVTTTLEINELRGNFTLADLVGRKFCSDMDIPADPLNAKSLGKLKKMTGGDSISSDVKFADRVNFACTTKFLFGTNHALLTQKADPAFFKRLVVVPFCRSFNGKEQDYRLPQKLAAERSAIIVQALTVYQNLRQNGFEFAGNYEVNQVLGCELPVSAEDAVAIFLKNNCEAAEGAWTPTQTLYEAFTRQFGNVCQDRRFSELLLQTVAALGLHVRKGRSRITSNSNPLYGFIGLKLKEKDDTNGKF